jgi:hypothetical protein
MAKAAENTVSLNWVQIFVGTAGFLALLYSLRLNRDATKAASKAADAADRAIAVASDAAERQLRAYLGVTPIRVDAIGLSTGGCRALVWVRNAGVTPAFNVRSIASLDIFPWPLPRDFKFPPLVFSDDPSVVTNFPGDDEKANNLLPSNSRVFSAEELAEARKPNGNMKLYAFGFVEYDDVFKQTQRTTKFCFAIMPLPGFGNGDGESLRRAGYIAVAQHSEAT